MGAIAWERLERGENDGLALDVTPGTDRAPHARMARQAVRLEPAQENCSNSS